MRGGEIGDWLVCGWFTEDAVYRPLAEQLAASLEQVGAPYDLVSAPKLSGGWEANTMAKPGQVLTAMDRHPGRVIVFMDVDFTATGDLSWLTEAPGDIGLKMGAKRRRSGSTRLTVGSQVIVIKPTQTARDFVAQWCWHSRQSWVTGDTDEATLSLTIGDAKGWAISGLDQTMLNACLVHHWANRRSSRIPGVLREAANMVRSIAGRWPGRPRLTPQRR